MEHAQTLQPTTQSAAEARDASGGFVLPGLTLTRREIVLLAFWLEIDISALIFAEALGVMFLIAFALTALGFMIAWRMESTQGYHAIMSVFLLPMWLLSGSLFPAAGVPAWLGVLITINPLTYGMAAFRHVLYGLKAPAHLPYFKFSLNITVA